MKLKKIGMQNQAVSGVIEALPMVALVSIVISLILLFYIPQVMEQREAGHMELASNQVSSLKSMIDLPGMTQSAWNEFLWDNLGMYATSTNPLTHISTPPSKNYIEIKPGTKGITFELNIYHYLRSYRPEMDSVIPIRTSY